MALTTEGANIPGIVAIVLLIPKISPAYLDKKRTAYKLLNKEKTLKEKITIDTCKLCSKCKLCSPLLNSASKT